jgi:hypothetical protein
MNFFLNLSLSPFIKTLLTRHPQDTRALDFPLF